jgi:fused signal recognition particle receptor
MNLLKRIFSSGPEPAQDLPAAEPPAADAEPTAAAEAAQALPTAQRAGWASRLKEGLSKSSRSLTSSISAIFTKRKLDAATLDELEDVLIQADLGVEMASRIVKAVAKDRYDRQIDPGEVKRILAGEIAKVLEPVAVPFRFGSEKPFVILVIGVNGSGKTTTIGKLGALAVKEGLKVTLAACDTFRAAAIEQLEIWGERTATEVIRQKPGADPSAVLFDALHAARVRNVDYVIVDTAGRLQTKANLMAELEKMRRTASRVIPGAPHEVLLVLDATTGQNGLEQARRFTETSGVTGIVLAKLDGTAKGGVVIAIARELNLPIRYVGIGEKIDDLVPFDPEKFIASLFEK